MELPNPLTIDKIREGQSGLDINDLKKILRRYAPQNDMLPIEQVKSWFHHGQVNFGR
jgi:hypothetical protein